MVDDVDVELRTNQNEIVDYLQEFIEQCEMLIGDLAYRETLTSNARNYVRINHSTEVEKQKYSWIVSQLLPA